ncbi:hypothetical protein SNEBB_006651 [Seison nebaliae]|nr:hypothetical protein SNEBB_006651 [Seison nebaliae]
MVRLYVGNLPNDVERESIEAFCNECGEVNNVDVKGNFAFVDINCPDTNECVSRLTNKDFGGCSVRVEPAHGQQRGTRGGPGRGGYRGGDRNNFYPRRGNYGMQSRGYSGGDGFMPSTGGRRYTNYRYNTRRAMPRGSRGRQRFGTNRPRPMFRCVVQNVPEDVVWQELKQFFQDNNCNVQFCNAHNHTIGEGLITFNTEEEMADSMARMEGMSLKSSKISLRQLVNNYNNANNMAGNEENEDE